MNNKEPATDEIVAKKTALIDLYHTAVALEVYNTEVNNMINVIKLQCKAIAPDFIAVIEATDNKRKVNNEDKQQ